MPWAVFLARSAAVGILLIGVAVTMRRSQSRSTAVQRVTGRGVPGIAVTGVIILASDAVYATSSTLGDLALVAVLSPTHPVVTIVLSRIHGKEDVGFPAALGSWPPCSE